MVTLLTLFAIALLGAGPAGAYFAFISPLVGLGAVGVGLALLGLLFFVAVVEFLRWGAGETNWLAFFFGLLSLVALGGAGYLAWVNPLYDVSTDVAHPPAFVHPAYPFVVEKGAEFLDPSLRLVREYAVAAGGTQRLTYPNFEGIAAKAPPAEVYAAAVKTIKEQLPGYKLVLEDPKEFRLEAEVEDPFIRIIHDVALEVRPVPKHAYDSRVELRSRSRIPLPDLGRDIFLLRDLKVRLNLAISPLEETLAQKRAEAESAGGEAPKVAPTAAPVAPPPPASPAPAPAPVPAPAKGAAPPAAKPAPAPTHGGKK